MYTKLIISLAIINFVYISSTYCYVASNYPREDVELGRGHGGSAGGQRGVKGGSRRGNVIGTTTNDGINNENTEYNPYGVRPSNSRFEDDAGGRRYGGHGVSDLHDTSRTDGQNRYQDRTIGRYDSRRGSSFRQDSNEFSRNDYRGHRGRTEGNDDSGNYRGYGRVDTSDSRHTNGYRGYTGSGSNPELSTGSLRVDGNSRYDESRTSGQRLSSDTDVPVPLAGVKTKTKRINYIGQGEPGIHY